MRVLAALDRGWRTAARRRLAMQASRRLGWGVADQAVSSVTNFAVNIYIARDLGAVQYGAFALAYVTYGFALNASRGLATDPLLVRFSGVDFPVWRRAVLNCTGTAVLVGLVTGCCVLVAGWLLGGAAGPAFFALGLTLPGLLLQDSWRFAFFALGRGSGAFVNDVIWAVTLLPALVILRRTGHADVFWFVLAWGAAATVAAAAGPFQAGLVPRLSAAPGWLSRQRDLGARYTAEGTANSGAAQLRSYSLGIILGLAALGYVQAASTLMGPLQILFYGMQLVALPEAARMLRRSPRHMPVFCGLISAALTLLALGWGVTLLVVLPRGLGHWLLGSLWRPAYPLVLPTTLYFMGMCASIGAGIWLHALAAARRSLRAAVVNSAAMVVFSVLGALVAGTAGSVRGAAIGTWIGAFFCWWQLRAALKENSGTPAARRPAMVRSPGNRRLRNGGLIRQRLSAPGPADSDPRVSPSAADRSYERVREPADVARQETV
jgi:O-antigen/teichoic acid export membrane protein